MSENVTIKDIAREIGVSVATVSRALNKHGNVRPITRDAVLAAAERLGYQENYLAKKLSAETSNMIGMLLPDIRVPFYGRIFSTCARIASANGYVLSFCNSFNRVKLETHFYQHSLAQHACGIIQIGGSLDRVDIPAQLYSQIHSTSEQIPVITSTPVEGCACKCVYVDNSRCMRMLLEYLIGLGHRRIAFIGGRDDVRSTIEKRRTYHEVLLENGIRDELIYEGNYGAEDGFFLTKKMLRDRERGKPTAIIAITDMCAVGVLQALGELGVRCGKDISVASFDNTYITEMLEPELTAISTDYEVLSQTIINTMIEMIHKRDVGDQFDLPLLFSIRNSCTKI